MKKKIILIGPCSNGDVPNNGAVAKNNHLCRYLYDHGANLKIINTNRWKRNPLILISLFISVLFHPNAKFIIATSTISAYHIIKVLGWLPMKRSIIYWVIGGSLSKWIKNGKIDASAFRYVEHFLVEGKLMQKTLQSIGFENTIYVPNFKHIDYVPAKPARCGDKVGFVFLSRIIPPKGCSIILNAVKRLNKDCGQLFCVDFYGPLDKGYYQEFLHEVDLLDNVSYKGVLNLTQSKNYEELAKYDVMLFPTGWANEGFPGVAIDAFIAGLPVIATDWSLNSEIIENGKTGFTLKMPLTDRQPKCIFDIEYVPFETEKSAQILAEAMLMIIKNPGIIPTMSANCQQMAQQYDINQVLTKELLERIGLI